MSPIIELSCEDYRFLLVVGPCREDMPDSVRSLMEDHEITCDCMDAKGCHQDLLDIRVTVDTETAAQELIREFANRVTLAHLYNSCELGHDISVTRTHFVDNIGVITFRDDATGTSFILTLK